ncbi:MULTISPECIES: MFS transporter [Paenarthrobacter]|jgi:MFS family permease|uniref:MFS family permease n=1 Tax=Paenarthrobacter nicotinovorans TaxID=29320 RepID=A0ABT9TLI0_PAENI|nr:MULTISPECIES: MFS transporter [Paenarthrobacter]KIA74513.1 transmembrane efflux protein (MFS) [Arthrobacter sp. MWB30]KQQ98584.1 MFS transporter [Arthrobacter sp. Leaf145]BCW09335.1 MFS transporter [Arthrobacter sp. NtRootA2]BCW13415.1 MFS transporter [Arthrobacter sp. NtRootA4]BCW21751.1 MFS transporter [Arthrobacter sp. NtRootC7]BCW26018.1 MFS transporter [Arthrobacter sp. NtRootC45]BCW30288.1 MFS transporter [Arthrobacter sp. NtRootD5]
MTSPTTLKTSAEPPLVSAVRWTRAQWLLLMVVCTVLALDGLDVSMVGVALPSIGQELHLGTDSLQWIVSAYVLGYGSLLLLGGRLADLLGRRRIFLIALTVFAAASLLGGLVDDPAVLIATRFVKGLAAAFTAPTGFSIITTNFAEGRERNKALSIFTTFGASGFSLGLVVGGLMTSLSWRWTFLVSVPIAVVVVLLGIKFIPKDKPSAENSGHDIWGAVTLALGMLGLVYTLVSAPEQGWGSVATIAGFAVSVAVLAAFAIIENKVKHPLIRFGILKEGWVARANLSAVGLFGSYLSFQFIVTMFLQSVLGWTPLGMALALLPAGLLVATSAPFADRLIEKFGATQLILTGLTALGLGYVLFLRVGTTPNYALDILPSVVLLGVGFALAFPSINVQATAGIKDSEQGLAAGLIQTSTQVGAALVLAVTTALVSGHGQAAGTVSAQAMLEQYRPGLILSAAVAIAALLVAAAPSRRRVRP